MWSSWWRPPCSVISWAERLSDGDRRGYIHHMMNNAIQIADLQVERGGRIVLPGLNLEVPAGQVVGLLGPSGGGKSTLMRAIVGVQVVEAGSVTVLDLPAGHRDLRHRVGYVTQAPSVYPDLSVRDNVRYFAQLVGVASVSAAADRAIDVVDLTDHAAAAAGSLSGGQRSRASLACALVGAPELLVLDEPTVGLDPALRRELWALFRRLASEGTTLLVSSHVMEEAARCDRVLLLRDGVLLADDTPDGLLAATGAADHDAAFLALVDAAGAPR